MASTAPKPFHDTAGDGPSSPEPTVGPPRAFAPDCDQSPTRCRQDGELFMQAAHLSTPQRHSQHGTCASTYIVRIPTRTRRHSGQRRAAPRRRRVSGVHLASALDQAAPLQLSAPAIPAYAVSARTLGRSNTRSSPPEIMLLLPAEV